MQSVQTLFHIWCLIWVALFACNPFWVSRLKWVKGNEIRLISSEKKDPWGARNIKKMKIADLVLSSLFINNYVICNIVYASLHMAVQYSSFK